MISVDNPAIRAFVAFIREELILAQVQIRRAGATWELRHLNDRSRPANELRTLTLPELRELAQFTADGQFRPLKSAPTLADGWRFECGSDAELYEALNRLYPGAVADWYAAQRPDPPVTHYREFAARQSGMYRITALLTDVDAVVVIRACCDARLCLKRRLWSVPGLTPDAASDKSLIPCLEPCAIALEATRKAARTALDQKAGLEMTNDE